jgi:hypothetical protein
MPDFRLYPVAGKIISKKFDFISKAPIFASDYYQKPIKNMIFSVHHHAHHHFYLT